MHELSVAMSLIEGVEEEAARHEGRVTAVHLKLGPLSGVVREALLSAFELASAGTSLEGVRLLIEDMPIVAFCRHCQARQTIASMQWFCCPVCEKPVSDIVQGRELQLEALEME
ncbi:MAG TPA: hydrogenase maturation nickel metallochaperone HypA [Bryobacteraceae bacterium]|nr:hydrogenase maturation nickel metallochaperone HypA [Bryobacteraceae bacterium]HXK00964.1 hydrogenase maturation nickel metallochaperone HypA [Verrucomicrobiae bacterium]